MSDPDDPPAPALGQRETALLTDTRFAKLWLAQGVSQTAQNAVLFALLVTVLETTNSSIYTSLLVLSFILPSILMGMAVGVLLDRWPKMPVLVGSAAVRASACILYIFVHDQVWAVFAVSLGFATAGLFFSPAVVAVIPTIVRQERLVAANSLYNFTFTGSQLIGFVFLSPIVLKAFGEGTMFAIGAALFTASAVLTLTLSAVREVAPAAPRGSLFGAMPREFRDAWAALRRDPVSFLAMAQLVMASSLVLLFAILIPRYMKDILNISADNAAFVFAPTGIGAIFGLRFIPWATRRFGKNRVVILGLSGITVCVIALALVQPLADILEHTPLNPQERLTGLSLLQALTMAFAAPMGFAYAFLSAPAQTVLHERAPAEMRGRIFTTQAVSANFLSLLPLLFIGGLTDLLDGIAEQRGVSLVLFLIAAATASLAIASARVGAATERKEAMAAGR